MSLGMMGGAFNGNMYCIKTLIELIKATVAADSVRRRGSAPPSFAKWSSPG